jgi:hypothetical protein
MDSADQLTIQYPPFSTRTLGLQTLVLSFLSVWFFAILIPSTLFSRTRSAHLTITGVGFEASLLSVEITRRYWDYGFCECSNSRTADNQNINMIKSTVLGGCPLVQPYLFTPCQPRDMGRMEIPVGHSI